MKRREFVRRRRRVPCEVYSRIVGYLRPVQNWNAGKRQEFYDRKVYQGTTQAASHIGWDGE